MKDGLYFIFAGPGLLVTVASVGGGMVAAVWRLGSIIRDAAQKGVTK